MPPLYWSDPVAEVLFWSFFGAWALVEMATYLRARRLSEAGRRDRGSRVVLVASYWLALAVAFVVAFAVPSAAITWNRPALFYAGIGMLLGGLLLRQYAIATLGRLHTLDVTTWHGQPVVEAGPYRWVRHPSYAGAMLTAAGILLASTNWLALACFALVAGAYAYRIWVEERALTADLGDRYQEYMRRTSRLIPYLI